MKTNHKYWLYKGRCGVFYLEHTVTHKKESLRTTDREEAERLRNAREDAGGKSAAFGMAMGRTWIMESNPEMASRTWQNAMDDYAERGGKDQTKARRRRAMKQEAFDLIRTKKIVETTAEDFRAVLDAGTISTNHHLRNLHNHALGFGWLPLPVLHKKQWPKIEHGAKRAISPDEHKRIVASEPKEDWQSYWEMLWELGAAQTDGALLKAENFDLNEKVVSFQRQKTKEWCRLSIGSRLVALLEKLPKTGLLFPRLAIMPEKDRAKKFAIVCGRLKIEGVTLHSYRYGWAERAAVAGVSERYAQAALGHSSKAVHRAYSKRAQTICPSLEQYEAKKVVPVDFSAAAKAAGA